jgi:hypothetical protein
MTHKMEAYRGNIVVETRGETSGRGEYRNPDLPNGGLSSVLENNGMSGIILPVVLFSQTITAEVNGKTYTNRAYPSPGETCILKPKGEIPADWDGPTEIHIINPLP